MTTFRLGAITLHLGDCRDLLPTLPAGASYLTDPVWPNVPAGLIPGSDRPDELFSEAMAALVEPRRIVIVMRTDSDPRMLRHVPAGLTFLRTIELPYAVPAPVGRIIMGGDVAYCYGPAPAWTRNRQIVAGRGPAAQPTPRSIGHPCPRPQSHADWLVERLTDATDLVIDPFLGSGTTAIAAMKAGRPFVGIEIDERYFEIACRRIEAAARQGDLFITTQGNGGLNLMDNDNCRSADSYARRRAHLAALRAAFDRCDAEWQAVRATPGHSLDAWQTAYQARLAASSALALAHVQAHGGAIAA